MSTADSSPDSDEVKIVRATSTFDCGGRCPLRLHVKGNRIIQGKLPNCIEACPVRALDAGPLGELEERYGTIREAEGFKVSARTRPAVVFKPKG
jgi:Fe-S-cluster-containing dehydrogenase component